MKAPQIENLIIDEANDRTYVVMANRALTDGELYRAIRVELLKRNERLPRGGRLTITLKP